MSGYVPAQVGIALVVVALLGRAGFTPALVLGTLTFGCLAGLAVLLPVEVAVAASLVVLFIGQRLVPAPVASGDGADMDSEPANAGWWMVALRGGVSLMAALGLLVVARSFGPAAGGAIGAYPIFTFTLCAVIFAASGQVGVRHVLAGMVRAFPPTLRSSSCSASPGHGSAWSAARWQAPRRVSSTI